MKKILVLFIISLLFFSGCATLGTRYTQIGRTIFNRHDPLIEDEQALENIARDYRITKYIKILIIGNDSVVQEAKEIFDDFGFAIAQDNYQGQVEYTVRVERENLGQEYSSTYGGIGYSGRRKNIVKAKIIAFDDYAGTEHRYEGSYDYKHRQYYSGYYHSSYSYQTDPGRIAFRAALMEAIGEFIEGSRIPHRWPEKK